MDGEWDLTRGDDAQRRRLSVVQIRERVRPAPAPDSDSPDEWSTRNADALTVRSLKADPSAASPHNVTPADQAAIFNLQPISSDSEAELTAEEPSSASATIPLAGAVTEITAVPTPKTRPGRHEHSRRPRGKRTIRWRRIVVASGLLAAVLVVVALADGSLTRSPRKSHPSLHLTAAHPSAPVLPVLSFTAVNDALAHAVGRIEAREKEHAAAVAHRRAQARKRARHAHQAALARRRAAAAKRAEEQSTTTAPVTSSTPTSTTSTSTSTSTPAAPATAPAPTSSSTSSKPKAFGEGGLLGAGHIGG
jgi:hypothetical protein